MKKSLHRASVIMAGALVIILPACSNSSETSHSQPQEIYAEEAGCRWYVSAVLDPAILVDDYATDVARLFDAKTRDDVATSLSSRDEVVAQARQSLKTVPPSGRAITDVLADVPVGAVRQYTSGTCPAHVDGPVSLDSTVEQQGDILGDMPAMRLAAGLAYCAEQETSAGTEAEPAKVAEILCPR